MNETPEEIQGIERLALLTSQAVKAKEKCNLIADTKDAIGFVGQSTITGPALFLTAKRAPDKSAATLSHESDQTQHDKHFAESFLECELCQSLVREGLWKPQDNAQYGCMIFFDGLRQEEKVEASSPDRKRKRATDSEEGENDRKKSKNESDPDENGKDKVF